jgi:DNA-nicking Smr family endonuclease
MAASKKRKASGPFDALRAMKEKLAAEEQAPSPPKPARAPPRRSSASEGPEDDALLFHRLFAGVRPLEGSTGRVPKERGVRSDSLKRPLAQAREAQQAEMDEVHERLRQLVDGGARFEVADDGRRVEGRRVDLPIDALRRLRRGLLPIDGRMDLHGMGVKEARAQLELFLRTMRARGERCVLLIHGKGEHSPHGIAVLRGEMAAWLSQGTSSQHVAAFATAREGDGGEGALYVLLRR